MEQYKNNVWEPWKYPGLLCRREMIMKYIFRKGKGKFIINGVEHPVSKGDLMFFLLGGKFFYSG